MFLRRIFAIAEKETKQLLRDRITFGMVVMIPLIQLLLFGYAINTNVRLIPVAVVDLSNSTIGRIIVEDIKATAVVSFVDFYTSVQEAEQAITEGRVRAVLILPSDLAHRVAHQQTVGQWIVDGSDTMVSSALLQLRNMPLPAPKNQAVKSKPQFEVALYFNPERRAAVNIVPGLLGIILTMTMILFTSAAIVRELNELSRDLNRPMGRLSRGTRQKINLIQGLQHRPKLLILDEPTEGLDPFAKRALFELLRRAKARGTTIFFSSHVLSELEGICDEVTLIRRGKLVDLFGLDGGRESTIHRVRLRLQDGDRGPSVARLVDRLQTDVGATSLNEANGTLSFHVIALSPLLILLADLPVAELTITPLSLEERVMPHYGLC